MADGADAEAKSPAAPSGRRSVGFLDIIDVVAKLLAASALVVGAFIANSYQSKLTGTTILSQREQSETQLRASMFNTLIDPVVGSRKGDSIPAGQETLLVELLALNFHEHFELKPLLVHADERLGAKQVDGMTAQQAQAAREALRSTVRRISAQQIASLIRESTSTQTQTQGCSIYLLNIQAEASGNQTGVTCQVSKPFEEVIGVKSPDGKYTLNAVVSNPDWENETFDVSVNLTTNNPAEEQRYQDLTYNFVLTWYDLPLTDNTLLPDGNRFAFTLAAVMKGKESTLRLIWFPKDYITPRERPLDYRQYLQLVGKQ